MNEREELCTTQTPILDAMGKADNEVNTRLSHAMTAECDSDFF